MSENFCGHTWKADYGDLPCDKPHGHTGVHQTYGSQGAILWRDIKVCNRRHKWVGDPPSNPLRRKCVKCGKVEVRKFAASPIKEHTPNTGAPK